VIDDRSSDRRHFSDHRSRLTGHISGVRLRQCFSATTPKAFGAGGKGIRTPDFQLAKLALYQLSYAPAELSILDCGLRIANLGGGVCELPICDLGTIRTLGEADAGWRSDDRHPGFVRFSAKLRSRAMESGPVSLRYRLARGTAKYASLAPVTGSVIALPVISPLSFMSLAVSRMAE
jgi:hypothetical protein